MSDFQRGLQAFERLIKSDDGIKTGSCRKCGGGGHLTFECRNLLKLDETVSKPKPSRFGFLRKQLSSAGSASGSASPSPATEQQSASDTKSSSKSSKKEKKHSKSKSSKKKRYDSSSSSDSESDSSSSDSGSDSDSYSDSDSEDDRKRRRGKRDIVIVPVRGMVERARPGEMIAIRDRVLQDDPDHGQGCPVRGSFGTGLS
ncbi:hypothetical protein BGZ94_000629 [Podila epigama]|nr:hypothetical protein BGZ94_000629 [Podila epigama]